MFCGDPLLVSDLRPSHQDGAKPAGGILSLLVKRLRPQWPEVRILFRGDSGFCRQSILKGCERHEVGFIVGIARNRRITAQAQPVRDESRRRFKESTEKPRRFDSFRYVVKTWNRKRRIIVKAEHRVKGANPRYIVTHLEGSAKSLYEEVYCARGEMENRIKEPQLDRFGDRRCHRWWPNPFRMLLSAMGYVLLETLRRLMLAGTELATA